MIAIINYDAGNLASVSNALERLGRQHVITADHGQLEEADGVIFPGVGHAEAAMESLRRKGLDDWLRNTGKPVLGICLGMQLFYESSEEGDSKGLGILPGRLKRFRSEDYKVPHMGWNTFSEIGTHPLLRGLDAGHWFYYVHSYYAPVNDHTLAACDYITPFAAVAGRDNYLGVQFHPEKSGTAGRILLQNFLEMVSRDTS